MGLTAMIDNVDQDWIEDCPGATFTFRLGRFFSHDMSNHASEGTQGNILGKIHDSFQGRITRLGWEEG